MRIILNNNGRPEGAGVNLPFKKLPREGSWLAKGETEGLEDANRQG